MKKILFFILLLIIPTLLLAQKSFNTSSINISKTTEQIKIDGELNESIWKNAEKAGDFYQNFPFDSSFANTKTEVMMSYDENFVYVAFICYDENMEKDFVVQSLKRDFDGGRNDFVTLYLDTFGDGANGFTFGITPLGVQREAMISDGGENLNADWDNKWYGEAKISEDRWVAEMAIPFKTLRYKKGDAPWKVNFARLDYKTNEYSSWVPVPRNFRLTSLAFTGDLNWDENLKKPGPNIVLIPFVTGGGSQNFVKGEDAKYTSDIGGDAKVAVTSSLNLDLTFNPDFSQVEVDQQVTNLDRFEIFFPERRQFFVENSDLFSRFGFSRIRPFFSRRIGIGFDTTTKQIVQNPIIYGARLSGKLNKNWRIGFMNMQTGKRASQGIEGQNYTVAAFQRKIFARSNIAAILVNRQRTSDSISEYSFGIDDFSRVVGLDYNMASKDNKWIGKFFYHQSLKPQNTYDQYAHASFLRYSTPKWSFNWNHEYVGKNYTADVGFVPRKNHWRIEPSAFYRIYPKKTNSVINNHGPGIYTNIFWNTEWSLTDRYVELSYEFAFTNGAFLGFYAGDSYVKLFSDFDPSGSGGLALLSGTDYNTQGIYWQFSSNYRKVFTWGTNGGYSTYYNGNRINVSLNASIRFQPFGSFSLNLNYNQITLPEPYSSADLVLVSPRFDLTFTRKLFFTLFLQYNNQINNANLNARFQWRFKPVSDLFIVYTDNYFPENGFQTKSRALVIKLTYWLNL